MSTVTIDGQAASRREWLQTRRRVIGASELAIVLGLVGSQVKLCLRKWGELPEEETSEEAAWGLRLEDDIAEAYHERTGRRIVETQRFAVHPEMPFLGATIDGLTECGRLVEFKSVGLWGKGADLGDDGDTDTVPDEWICQVNQGMAIGLACGLVTQQEADIAVFGPGLRLRVFTARYSEGLATAGAQAASEFWNNFVAAGVLPPDVQAADAETLVRAYRRDTGEFLELGEDTLDAAVRYRELGDTIRDLERERAKAKAELLMALGDASGATLPGGWEVRRKLVEVKEHAVKASTQVRLMVKEPK